METIRLWRNVTKNAVLCITIALGIVLLLTYTSIPRHQHRFHPVSVPQKYLIGVQQFGVSSNNMLTYKEAAHDVNMNQNHCFPKPGSLSAPGIGRLGNQMFQYATIHAIARRLGMTTFLHRNSDLITVFNVQPDMIGNREKRKVGSLREAGCCVYDTSLLDIPCYEDIELCCYLQSWRYYEGFEKDIRSQFAFRPSIMRQANAVWEMVILPAALKRNGAKGMGRTVYVAVHVRRGDKVNSKASIDYGNRAPSSAYLLNGYRFFQNKFNNSVQFVVSTDDPAWVRKVLPSSVSVFVNSDSPEVDMAVLSLCNHTLMTVGTFGWWVAWLVNGTTVYYKDMVKPGSPLATEYNHTLKDWVLPTWIGME